METLIEEGIIRGIVDPARKSGNCDLREPAGARAGVVRRFPVTGILRREPEGGCTLAGGSSVFVVEDDPIIAEVIEWRIRELGYSVCNMVQTGEEAVEYCQKARPDVVLMDIRLKGKINGIEAALKIKQQLKIPVIFLTAHSEGKYLEQAREVMPDGFIRKPFDDDDIRIALSLVL